MRYYLTLLLVLSLHFGFSQSIGLDSIHHHLRLAQELEAQEKISAAIQTYELARSIAEKEQMATYEVDILNRLGTLYQSKAQNYEQAESCFTQADSILAYHISGEAELRNTTWFSLANLYYSRYQNDDALQYFKKTLDIRKKMFGPDHSQVAEALDKIGRVYLYRLQNPYEARKYHEQTSRIRKMNKDYGRSYVSDFYNLAVANRLLGEYEEALAFGFKALAGYDSLPESTAFNQLIANSLLGSIYFDMDLVESALEYNMKAIRLCRESSLSGLVDMSPHYNNHAWYHFKNQTYDSTIYYAGLAIQNQDREDLLGSSYQFLGNAYRELGEVKRAFQYYQKSKMLKESFFQGRHTQLSTLYIDLAYAFEKVDETDSALLYYNRAIQSARISRNNDPFNESLNIEAGDDLPSIQEAVQGVCTLLFDVYKESGETAHLERAQPYFLLFDRFMELSRTNFSSEGSKLFLSGNHKAMYEKAIQCNHLLYQHSRKDSLLQQIFNFMEKSKATVLLESIRQSEVEQQTLPDSIGGLIQSYQASLAYINSELTAAQNFTEGESEIQEWQLKKAAALQKLNDLSLFIQQNYPNYYDITFRDTQPDIRDIQAKLGDRQVVISYFWGDSSMYALRISQHELDICQIQALAPIQKAIEDYQTSVTGDAPVDPSYQNYLKFQKSAHTLYQILLAPLLADVQAEQLTLVTDGRLTSIPFESLLLDTLAGEKNDIQYNKLPYLIRSYAVNYEFSMRMAYYRQETLTAKTQLRANPSIVAFGISSFNLPSLPNDYADLRGAEKEVRHMQEIFPEAQIFLNTKATEKQFKAHAPQADLLHIATHGFANTENPFASQFVFFPDGQEDGILNLYELYSIPLKASTLLLSACESGVGKHYAGEGSYSLARSFVYAGCKSVIMSLWQINDLGTEKLVTGLYNQLSEGHSPGTSLRQTKLQMIDSDYAHPQFWAGMIQMGQSSLEFTHDQEDGVMVASLSIALILILTLVLVIYIKSRRRPVFAGSSSEGD